MDEFKIGSLVVLNKFGPIYQISATDDLGYVRKFINHYELYTNEFIQEPWVIKKYLKFYKWWYNET